MLKVDGGDGPRDVDVAVASPSPSIITIAIMIRSKRMIKAVTSSTSIQVQFMQQLCALLEPSLRVEDAPHGHVTIWSI